MAKSISRRSAILIAGILTVTPSSFGLAGPHALVQSSIDGDRNGCGFVNDSMSLSVIDQGKEIAREDYCSAYGQSSAEVLTDEQGRNFVLLRYQEGHGTNATVEYLKVYRLTDDLREIGRFPLSWGVGATARWAYELRAERRAAGGLKLIMSGHVNEDYAECCVPPESSQTITIDVAE